MSLLPYRHTLTIFIGVSLLISVSSSTGWAQASLAAEDKIDEVPVTIDGVKESFTVIRDARTPEQWYYAPDRPRLFERTFQGRSEPDFALIRYQFKDPKNPQSLLEGGLVQFAVSLGIPSEAIPQLVDAIGKKSKIPKEKIRLAALPMKSATVALYTPQGDFMASTPQGAGIAPTFATQKMVFSVALTKIGSDVYDELVKGNTGIPVAVEFTYSGVSPPLGFKVSVNWDQTYSFYSKDEKFRARASVLGYFGATTDAERQKIRETLEQNNCIKIEVITGSGFKMEDANKYIEPMLNRINQEILENLKAPEKITPTEAGKPELSKAKFLTAGYSVAVKDVKKVKKGTETLTFDTREVVERKTVASGFAGIGRYPEPMRNKLVTIVPPGPWRSAFFVLPAVGDAEDLGINQVDLEIGLKTGDKVRESQVVMWRPKEGWKDKNGQPRTVLVFGLMGLGAGDAPLKNASFASKAKITLKREVLEVTQQSEVFSGETAITTPLAAVEAVAVDGSNLTWRRIKPEADLVFVNVTLQSGGKTFSPPRLQARRENGKWVEPGPMYWLIPKSSAAVTAVIKFGLNDGRMIDWKHNGKDLRQALSSLEITLLDSDVK